MSKQIIDTLIGQRGARAHNEIGLINESIVAFRVLGHEEFGSRLVLIEAPATDYAGASKVIKMLSGFLAGYVALQPSA